MRKTGKTLVLAAVAAVAAGMTSPALAATARHEPVSRSAAAFASGSDARSRVAPPECRGW
jgi:hypothetical protein